METKATAGMYHDFNGLSQLKTQARQDEGAALQEVAKQFESLFLGMMLKSMRSASLGDGIMDSDQSRFYQEMYDQQIATDLGQNGSLGLSDLIVKQLGGELPATDTQETVSDTNEHKKTVTQDAAQASLWSAAQLSLLNDKQ